MSYAEYLNLLKETSTIALNNYPLKFPCQILKEKNYITFKNEYVISKNSLAQILHETFETTKGDLEFCIPVIIALSETSIEGIESKGIYMLDNANNQYIYLFSEVDQQKFFRDINIIKNLSQIESSLVIGYLSNPNYKEKSCERCAEVLHYYLNLHGNLNSYCSLLDAHEKVVLPILSIDYEISILQWVVFRSDVNR